MSKNVLGLMSQIYLTFNNVPIFNGTLEKECLKLTDILSNLKKLIYNRLIVKFSLFIV